MKKSLIVIIIIIIIALIFSCATFMHDQQNPCYKKMDSVECDYWKARFPREYQKFDRRSMKK